MRSWYILYKATILSYLLTSTVQSFTSLPQPLLPTPQIVHTITTTNSFTRVSFYQNHNNQDHIRHRSNIGSGNRKPSVIAMAVSDAWDAYNNALELHPLIVKSITASIILGLGDFAGQAVQSVQSNSNNNDTNQAAVVDYGRAARFALFGLVLQAPWNHYYYLLLDGQIPPTVDDPFSTTNMIKVGIDQFIQAPIFTVLIFVFLGVLEGKGYEDIKKQLQNDYPETIVANCKSTTISVLSLLAWMFSLIDITYLTHFSGIF
jgi:peroxisomal membrane protein 2